jgi:hypothetical protein
MSTVDDDQTDRKLIINALTELTEQNAALKRQLDSLTELVTPRVKKQHREHPTYSHVNVPPIAEWEERLRDMPQTRLYRYWSGKHGIMIETVPSSTLLDSLGVPEQAHAHAGKALAPVMRRLGWQQNKNGLVQWCGFTLRGWWRPAAEPVAPMAPSVPAVEAAP